MCATGPQAKGGLPDNSGDVIWCGNCAGFVHVIEDALPSETGAESSLPWFSSP